MGQSWNIHGIKAAFEGIFRPKLLVPHRCVRDISQINWLHAKNNLGIRAVVFDKDNTITAPYSNEIASHLIPSWQQCKSIFGTENMLIVSNSAGTDDDVGHQQAKIIEESVKVHVLRHKEKKPSGASLLIQRFNLRPAEIMIVGDRLLTDIVYGNRIGACTVFITTPITTKGDNPMAIIIRNLEHRLLRVLQFFGMTPPSA